VYEKAEEAIEDCDLLIVAGTSLSVSPACNLVSFRNLHKTVIVNRDATEKDGCASLVIHSELGEVFSRI
jgi:NAD-dependent deacetylase